MIFESACIIFCKVNFKKLGQLKNKNFDTWYLLKINSAVTFST